MHGRRITLGVAFLFALTASGAIGCGDDKDPVDPDSHARPTAEDRAAVELAVRDLALTDVVAAAAGVTAREAPAVLERWLQHEGDRARPLLERWPRRADGALDLTRAPVRPTHVDGSLFPGKSRCGEVVVIFRGDAPPSLRLKLDVPGTSRLCRHTTTTFLHDRDALSALSDAIAAGRVPDSLPPAPTIAAQ